MIALRPAPPAAPVHLSAAMKDWWLELLREYEFQSHHVKLLHMACEAYDRAEAAREQLESDGLTVATQFGQKPHPCAGIERESRNLFVRCMHELGLDNVPPPASSKRR